MSRSSRVTRKGMSPVLRMCAALLVLGSGACNAPSTAIDPQVAAEEHRKLFGEFELPQKIGSVPNLGLQLPALSPDGTQLVYLRTDRELISPMTLLGSTEPNDTPAEGTLSLWLRPATGSSLGQRISRGRWAHSAAWSPSGRFVAYVAAHETGTVIVRHEIATGREETFGAPEGVHALPVFDGADEVLLFCHGQTAAGPFEVCRQSPGDAQPTVCTPEGADCVLPLMTTVAGQVICGKVEGGAFSWARCSRNSTIQLVPPCGPGGRPVFLQSAAGITVPVSPDRGSFLFYDLSKDRIAECRWGDPLVRRHRPGSIAACWLTDRAIALATAEGLFVVETRTGASVSLLSGSWLPLRYVPQTSRLYLLTADQGPARFSLYELAFKPASQSEQQEQ